MSQKENIVIKFKLHFSFTIFMCNKNIFEINHKYIDMVPYACYISLYDM